MNDSQSTKFLWFIKLTLLSLSILYLLQLASPLRLNYDAIIFISLAESFINGQGFLYHGLPTHFPPGYPALLSFLDFIGLGYSWGFIATNLAFLAVGNIMLFYICNKKFSFNKAVSYVIIVFALFSWVIIKHVAIPLSDLPFYGLSMVAIALLSYAESAKENRTLFFLSGVLLAGLAITVRTIGIAIYAALILQVLYKKFQAERFLTFNFFKNHILIFIFLSAAATSTIILVVNSKYFGEALQAYYSHGGFLKGILMLWGVRLRELGELFINIPITKIPGKLAPIIPFIGLAFLGMLIYIFYNRRNKLLLVDYYIVSYLLIIFFWPYKDPRFWLPIMPLLICEIAFLAKKMNISRLLEATFCTYLIIFSLMGMLALGYSTRLSLSGPRFPDYYSDDYRLRNAYRIFLSKEDQPKECSANEEALHLLQRFNNAKRIK
jgi:hypothetical protein